MIETSTHLDFSTLFNNAKLDNLKHLMRSISQLECVNSGQTKLHRAFNTTIQEARFQTKKQENTLIDFDLEDQNIYQNKFRIFKFAAVICQPTKITFDEENQIKTILLLAFLCVGPTDKLLKICDKVRNHLKFHTRPLRTRHLENLNEKSIDKLAIPADLETLDGCLTTLVQKIKKYNFQVAETFKQYFCTSEIEIIDEQPKLIKFWLGRLLLISKGSSEVMTPLELKAWTAELSSFCNAHPAEGLLVTLAFWLDIDFNTLLSLKVDVQLRSDYVILPYTPPFDAAQPVLDKHYVNSEPNFRLDLPFSLKNLIDNSKILNTSRELPLSEALDIDSNSLQGLFKLILQNMKDNFPRLKPSMLMTQARKATWLSKRDSALTYCLHGANRWVPSVENYYCAYRESYLNDICQSNWKKLQLVELS